MGAIDTSVIGTEMPVLTADIERGRLRSFALAIGETDPVYRDVDAAKAAGHADLPVPPTFLFGLAMGGGADDFAWLADLGVDLRHILHGEQSFTYHAIAHAGDTVTLAPKIVDVFSKRGGALQFIVRETGVRDSDGNPVADLRDTIVFRDPGAGL
jgi:hypothetical protein